MSVWSRDGSRKADLPVLAEREAVRLLVGVGGDVEWWIWNPAVLVAHLRVAVTAEENEQIPAACVIADAGPSGPPRPRTHP